MHARNLLAVLIGFLALNTGCATRRAVHFTFGSLRADRIEQVTAAWASSNEVRVAVLMAPAGAAEARPHLLTYRLPTPEPGKPTTIWWVQFQSRKGIARTSAPEPPQGFRAMRVSGFRGEVAECVPSQTYFALEDAASGADYFLTTGACLGVRVSTIHVVDLQADWASRQWIAFDPAYHHRWWALPAVGVAMACDAAVFTLYLVPDVLYGLGGATVKPSGQDRFQKMAEERAGVPWIDRITPPRLR